jgi:NADH-ubiquinone oxidoreductase chain 4
VAMSSVRHIRLIVCRLITITLNRKTACIWLILSHGYSSSGLFFILNNLYIRSISRRIFLCKNNFSYYIKFWLILLCFINLPAPPSANFISEIIIFFRILIKNNFAIIFFATYFLTSSAYSMYLYYRISSYSVNIKYRSSPLTIREVNILFIHIFFSFVSFMFMRKLV